MSSKSALLYFPIDSQKKNLGNLMSKCYSIIDAFKEINYKTDSIFHYGEHSLNFNEELITINSPQNKIEKQLKFYNLYNNLNILESKYDVIFIRFTFASPYSHRFLQQLREAQPQATIILEYPTYPFLHELKNPFNRLYSQTIDLYYRKKHKELVDYVIVYDESREVLGVPSINLTNGFNIDLKQVDSDLIPFPLVEEFVITGISANINNVYGFDRVLHGIAQYNGNYKVKFNLIGQGPAVDSLIRLAQELNIDAQFEFWGYLDSHKIVEVLDQSHVSIVTLGLHRSNLEMHSALKSSFYCLAGTLMIDAAKDLRFPEDFPYRLILPAEDKAIDIQACIDFYQNTIKKFPDYRKDLNTFANENLSWKSQIKKIDKLVFPPTLAN